MARRRLIAEEEPTEINLSSMIDCIFILLIFFIVTTVFVEEAGIQVNKPDAAATPSTEETENVVLEITSRNKVLLGTKEIPIEEVAAVVRENMVDEDTPVVIRANEKSIHATFVAVWDQAILGGAKQLSFSTVN
jgi:biopolymer transport protein ExbD